MVAARTAGGAGGPGCVRGRATVSNASSSWSRGRVERVPALQVAIADVDEVVGHEAADRQDDPTPRPPPAQRVERPLQGTGRPQRPHQGVGEDQQDEQLQRRPELVLEHLASWIPERDTHVLGPDRGHHGERQDEEPDPGHPAEVSEVGPGLAAARPASASPCARRGRSRLVGPGDLHRIRHARNRKAAAGRHGVVKRRRGSPRPAGRPARGAGRRRTRTCPGRSSSWAGGRRAGPSRRTSRRPPRRSTSTRPAAARRTRPRAQRPTSAAVAGNGVPSRRAIVVSTASSIAGVTSASSWRSQARCS